MSREQIDLAPVRGRVQAIFEDLFGITPEEFDRAVTLQDLPGWDSLNQVRLITGLEEEFGISFEPEDLESLEAIERLLGLVAARAAQGS